MDWVYIEAKYNTLREDYDRMWDKWVGAPNDENYEGYIIAKQKYMIFCTEVLEELMEENSDVLKRLKEC